MIFCIFTDITENCLHYYNISFREFYHREKKRKKKAKQKQNQQLYCYKIAHFLQILNTIYENFISK